MPEEAFEQLKQDYLRQRAEMAAHYDQDQLFVPEDIQTVKTSTDHD